HFGSRRALGCDGVDTGGMCGAQQFVQFSEAEQALQAEWGGVMLSGCALAEGVRVMPDDALTGMRRGLADALSGTAASQRVALPAAEGNSADFSLYMDI
ncbi:MAG: hypothetical protein ACK4MU_09300, partial [Thermomonas sp.]